MTTEESAGASARAMVSETHISVLFFVGDRAYKLKKPVHLDFVDLSTVERRAAMCRREVELNRRLAPDVYLGTDTILDEHGDEIDHLVVMRRMPVERRLSTLVRTHVDVDDELRAIARLVATFHARAETSPTIDAAGTVDAVRRNWDDNVTTMEPFVGPVLDPEVATRVATRAHRYLSGRAALFASRVAEHKVVDGHGDLMADDIFCLPDGPRILDCIEFDDHLRHGDVLADVTFLAMDLERLGDPELRDRFLRWYREFSAETFPASLAHHYLAYRAHVRSKVACLRSSQGDPDAPAEAAQLLAIADRHLAHGRVQLVLIGGSPGSGKSTLAAGLAAERDITVIRSDEIRKDLAGISHTEHHDHGYAQGLYAREVTDATYRTMLDRARSLLAMGESVLLDASWTEARFRALARNVAEATTSDLVALRCEVAPEIAAARIAARRRAGSDVSDATAAVAEQMAATADPWPDSIVVDTSAAPRAAVANALTHLDPLRPAGTAA